MKKTRLVAVFGIKYEPQWLVDELIENLKGWVDDFAIVDCRYRKDELWIHEGQYRVLQREAYMALDADWVLVTSPDERFEDRAGDIIRPLIDGKKDRIIYEFPLREMFTPTKYRTDGIWGRKTRPRLFPVLPGQTFTNRSIQSSPTPNDGSYTKQLLDVNLYHLKMIEPENRDMRAIVYEKLDPNYRLQNPNAARWKRLDPEGKFRKDGYHYLAKTEGMELELIPKGREFSPAYTKKYIFDVPDELLTKK